MEYACCTLYLAEDLANNELFTSPCVIIAISVALSLWLVSWCTPWGTCTDRGSIFCSTFHPAESWPSSSPAPPADALTHALLIPWAWTSVPSHCPCRSLVPLAKSHHLISIQISWSVFAAFPSCPGSACTAAHRVLGKREGWKLAQLFIN